MVQGAGAANEGPAGYFGPPGLLKWPAMAFLKENSYKSLISKVVDLNSGPYVKNFGHPWSSG